MSKIVIAVAFLYTLKARDDGVFIASKEKYSNNINLGQRYVKSTI